MAILNKEVSSSAPARQTAAPVLPPRIENYQPGLTKDQSIARSVSINNTFGAGWFKDIAQTMSFDDAMKTAFAAAESIEKWLTR